MFQACLNMPKVTTNSQFFLKNELSYEVSFFPCGKEAIEVTRRDFQNFSGVLKFSCLQQTFMAMNYKFL